MKHKGMHQHRLKQNPLEKKFAKEWERFNTINLNYNTVDYLLAPDNNNPVIIKKDERVIAATVIQWLGSCVGQSFLTNVLKGSIKKDRNGEYYIQC